MQNNYPESGLFLQLKNPEDKTLFSITLALVSQDVGSGITYAEFLCGLMRSYLSNRSMENLVRSSRPRL